VRQKLLGCYTYLEFGACMVAWVPILGVVRLLHRGDTVPRVAGRWFRRMGRTATNLTPLWRIAVAGAVPADIATRAYVVVSNHSSNTDPFLLSHLPWDMRWIAKEELFKVPLVGWLMHLSGDISLRRGDGESVRRMLTECRRTLDAGLSVMIFPEGTRSRNAELRPFKDGAFRLAIEARVPILPIAVSGTRECMPKGSWWPHEAHPVATVLEPIATDGLGIADVQGLRDLARARITAALSPIAGEKAPSPEPRANSESA
jgi:1-acyl-sn-glycerol-3-phosphate acyltransferase